MCCLASLAIAISCVVSSVQALAMPDVLDRPAQWTGGKAARIGFHVVVSLTLQSKVPIVFQEDIGGGEPRLSSPVEWGPHVRDVLDAFVALDQRYEWRIADNVIVVRPKASAADPNDFLNRRIKEFSFESSDPVDRLQLVAAIRHLWAPNSANGSTRIAGPPPVPGPHILLRLTNVTPLDVLVSAVRQDGEITLLVGPGFALGHADPQGLWLFSFQGAGTGIGKPK